MGGPGGVRLLGLSGGEGCEHSCSVEGAAGGRRGIALQLGQKLWELGLQGVLPSPLKGQYLRHLLELCGLEGEVPDVILFLPRWFSLVAKTLNWLS